MPRRLVLVLVIAFGGLAACSPSSCPPATAATAAAPSSQQAALAGKVLDDWHAAAAAAEEERYFSHFAPGGVFLGTDGKERWTVPQFRAYAHPHFAKGKAWSFRSVRRDFAFTGDVAWFDEDLDTPNLGPARGSGVLVKDGTGAWKIAQYNLSVPIPNERFKDVKALIEHGQ
jgi:hypothetical protein